MAEYVCTQLSNANILTVQRTCTAWQEITPFLPDLSSTQWTQIAIAMITVLAVAWVFKTLSTFVKEF